MKKYVGWTEMETLGFALVLGGGFGIFLGLIIALIVNWFWAMPLTSLVLFLMAAYVLLKERAEKYQKQLGESS